VRAKTFIGPGRRAQIITAAIEVIAEAGYAKASFSRIAKHAGLSSTGMISYHFAGKEDLLAACVDLISLVTNVVWFASLGCLITWHAWYLRKENREA
jgi:AcrR family transcriptional regulator